VASRGLEKRRECRQQAIINAAPASIATYYFSGEVACSIGSSPASLNGSHRPVCDGHGNSSPATLKEEAVKTNLKRAFVSAAAIGVITTALAGAEPLHPPREPRRSQCA
jgi:hypothetical protein